MKRGVSTRTVSGEQSPMIRKPALMLRHRHHLCRVHSRERESVRSSSFIRRCFIPVRIFQTKEFEFLDRCAEIQQSETLYAIIYYSILCYMANCHAQVWFELASSGIQSFKPTHQQPACFCWRRMVKARFLLKWVPGYCSLNSLCFWTYVYSTHTKRGAHLR